MRQAVVTLARNVGNGPLQRTAEALLPPIPLYRALLRTHRALPAEMRTLGDSYVREEFKRHRDVKETVHIVNFLISWKGYLEQLQGSGFQGARLEGTAIEKFSDQQLGQLYELYKATNGLNEEDESSAAAEAQVADSSQNR